MDASFTVFIIDDELPVRRGLQRLLLAAGYQAEIFANAGEFLTAHDPAEPGCVIVDLAMPEVDGLELQQTLTAAGANRPIIFVTGRRDIPATVRAMKAGAIDFLTKPVDAEALLTAVKRAKALDAERRRARAEMEAARALVARLSPREREVLRHVVAGRLNKQIAADLGTVEKTIKVHRGRMMQKLEIRTVQDLMGFAERAGMAQAPHPGSGAGSAIDTGHGREE